MLTGAWIEVPSGMTPFGRTRAPFGTFISSGPFSPTTDHPPGALSVPLANFGKLQGSLSVPPPSNPLTLLCKSWRGTCRQAGASYRDLTHSRAKGNRFGIYRLYGPTIQTARSNSITRSISAHDGPSHAPPHKRGHSGVGARGALDGLFHAPL